MNEAELSRAERRRVDSPNASGAEHAMPNVQRRLEGVDGEARGCERTDRTGFRRTPQPAQVK